MRGAAVLVVALLGAVAMAVTSSQTGATTLTVTSTADDGPGSLRAALASAGNDDIINFSLTYPATISLTGGELLIVNNITISGPGSMNLTVSGNNGSRVFHVGPSNSVTISGLTIADGVATAGGVGAGIYVENATLTLTNCAIRNNHASGGSTAAGGGVYASQSNLIISGCTLENNIASGNGGSIYNFGLSLTIDRSTLSNNSALNGGGIFNASGIVSVTNSLIYQNGATHGGGIANVSAFGFVNLSINDCTFASNTVSGTSATGSQIYNSHQVSTAVVTVANSTVLSNNVAPTYSGAAIFNDNGTSVRFGNTIIQASSQEHTIINVGAGFVVSDGFNLAFDDGNGFLTQPTDQINTDPLLDIGTGPRDNGGPTFTIPLQGNSPAIDKGRRDIVSMFPAPFDQRGEPRPFNDPNIPDAAGGDGSDIGAYEADLRLTKLVRATNDLQFSFTSIVGKTYQLQSRSSLVTGNWNLFGNTASGNGGIAQLTATSAFGSTAQFYRVLQSP